MFQKPRLKTLAITWIILLIYLVFDFGSKAKHTFFQLNYDWEQLVVNTKFPVAIDSVSHDYFQINKMVTNNKIFSENDSYRLQAKGVDSYFRTTQILESDSAWIFSGVKWINVIPDTKLKNGMLTVIDLPLLQEGDKKVITMGDSQAIWRKGREFRLNLSRNEQLFFVGSQKDIYGYPHEAYTFYKTADLLNRLDSVEEVPLYILFFGAQDKGVDSNALKENVTQLLKKLDNRSQSEKIVVINLPPSDNEKVNKYNSNFNLILEDVASSLTKVEILDLNTAFINEDNVMAIDQVHLNENGYYLLNKLLLKAI